MVKKTLQRKLLVADNNECSGYNSPIELEYYVLESTISYKDDLAGENVYGVSISKKINDSCYEEKVIKNLSCSFTETKNIINKLADNGVTPISLDFILDDLLGT